MPVTRSLRLAPLSLCAACFCISSCQTITQRPTSNVEIDVPLAFASASSKQNQQIAFGWLKEFNDPQLSSLVHRSLANNPDLKVTAANFRRAKEDLIIARAARLPTLSGNSRGSLSRSDGETSDSYGLSVSTSWEPDLWGRLRDLEKASFADYQAAVADFRAAQLSLAANTAQAYCNLITAEQQLTLAEQTLTSFQKNFNIIERGYKAGTLRALDVNFGRNNVASAERSVRSRRLARNNAARTLQLLLGNYPDASINAATRLPNLKKNVRAGLPASLLERRPDLAAARARIFASAKSADASRKSLLPNLRLTGSSGTSSTQLRNLLDPATLVSSLTASLTQSFFTGGELSSRARRSLLSNQQAIDRYLSDALQAFREVESALDADQSLAEQESFLKKEVRQATLAEQQAERDLIEGIDTRAGSQILEVLEAQRRALNARSNLINLRNQRIQNRLDLYLALGGSFE